MIQNTIETLSWIAIAQSLFVIILLLIRRQKIADYIFCVWIGLLGLSFVQTFVTEKFGNYTWAGSLVIYLAISPSIYLYSKYIVDTYPKFQSKDYLHYIPAFLLQICIVVLSQVPDHSPNPVDYTKRFDPIFIFFGLYYSVSTIVYLFLSIKKVLKFRKQVYDAYSYKTQQIQLTWLIVIFFLQIIYLLLNSVLGYGYTIGKETISNTLYDSINSLIMVYLLSFGGVLQKQLVIADSLSEGDSINSKEEDNVNNEKPDNNQLKPLADQLITYIENSRAWRDSELSIAKLSTATGIQKHLITQTLNEYLGKNFYTLINGYRIEEAKRMMHDEKYKNYTFMSIAYDCGFNSKTAFYTAFKKITGTTPTEYQKNA